VDVFVTLAKSDNPNLLQLIDVSYGVENFDLAAKFCYDINFEITTSNGAVLRCGAESLAMTESYNLVARTESCTNGVLPFRGRFAELGRFSTIVKIFFLLQKAWAS